MVGKLFIFGLVGALSAFPAWAGEADEVAPGYEYRFGELENETLTEVHTYLPAFEKLLRDAQTTYAKLFVGLLDSIHSPGYQVVSRRAFANSDRKTPCRNRGRLDEEYDKGCFLVYFRLEYTYKTPTGETERLVGRGSLFKWTATGELSRAGLDYFRIIRPDADNPFQEN